jgi:choline dehydrogenase-like flavoprotein
MLDSYLDRAAEFLNLGPNKYDDGLWKLMGLAAPQPPLDPEALRSFFWQFARSRLDRLDIMRLGPEFTSFRAKNVRVLLNATVTEIGLSADGRSFENLAISTIDGARSQVRAKVATIAASAVENARILLTSRAVQARGIGNEHDLVGRFLMDHVGARIGRFEPDAIQQVARRFGFYGLREKGRTHMYMHGLALPPAIQEREGLLNSAVYFMPDRSPDDPWDALKRLLKGKSNKPFADARSVMSGTKLLATGIGMKALAADAIPNFLKDFVVNTAVRLSPNLVAEEFQSRGLPHKLSAISIDAISEQKPDSESRITLSPRTDKLGVPLAMVNWRINDDERRTIVKIAHITKNTLAKAGLPIPILEPWVAERRPKDGVIIDMAHTAGTTRMSTSPASGVVDENCQVHSVRGLYVAGASTFPTSGHANPTLMIVALAIRVADAVKLHLRQFSNS